ncbi:peptide ABC transporter substrate-binding protein [Lutispora saccharofermentans]|uniref:Peptide ABC transporter substrate-binding protein n=1 Tax=Lutispora saccharofermentans TaxID=3024236 RepID=A0ABT1NB60_9FIRM|nr:peptide ABC transporter substrate-binding protein [Lutispora saccharofermentans]MCQ1528495.1 peptide ABC transporter substrate-binding protein [Lutispora saccharofermentans]
MKRRIFPIALLIIISLLAVSCSKPEIEGGTEVHIEDEKPGKGGVINIGCIEPLTFNPLLVNSRSYGDLTKLLFNGLVEYNNALKPVLVLADDISFAEGTGQAVVKLKENLHWSDGVRLTSEDVKFTLDTIKNSPDSIYKSKLNHIISYQMVNDVTIKINFGNWQYSAMDSLIFPIIPKHVFGTDPNATPVGTGPYKVSSYSKLKYMELKANEYSMHNTTSYITTIRVNFIKDMDSFDTAFQSGQIDIINASSYGWEKYKELRNVNTYRYLSRDYEFIAVNFQNPVLAEVEIRKALMYGINRKAIIEKYLLGNAAVTDTPIRSDSWMFDGDVNKYTYSKAEAQYAINNAKFLLNEKSNIYEREIDGKKQQLKLSFITNSENDYRKKAAEDIKRSLEEIGFVIDLKIMPFEEVKKQMESKKFDLALVGMSFSPESDLYDFLHSTKAVGGKNYGSYSNPRVDILLEESQNFQSQENKYVNYLELQRIIKDELPVISLFYKEYALVMRSKVRGEIQADSENLFRTINNWYITESLRQDE